MTSKVTMKIRDVEVEGISFGDFMRRLGAMKENLEALGCEVNITIDDQPIEEVKWIEMPEWYKERFEEIRNKGHQE